MKLYQLSENDYLGIGMGSPGIVDNENWTVTGAYNLSWYNTIDVGLLFEKEFNLPFFIDNDANTAVLGEQLYGSGKNASNIVMITLGTGIRGGLLIDGKIVRGSTGVAGELGHMTIDKDSEIRCACGKIGCFEALASGTGLLNLTRRHSESFSGESNVKSRIDNGEDLTSKEIFEAAKNNDIFAKYVIEEFSEYLGFGCSHIVNLLNPSKIILGGGIAQAGEFLRNMVLKKCDNYTYPALKNNIEIVIATLGNDAALLGAAELVKKDR